MDRSHWETDSSPRYEDDRLFTQYVRLLAEGHEPTIKDLDPVWTQLRQWLKSALKKRSMWDKSPIFLGIKDNYWTRHETHKASGFPVGETRDALDELTQIAYKEIFLSRLKTFFRYLSEGRNIEKVIRDAIPKILHDQQKSRDHLGNRLYEWLRSAVAEVVSQGTIQTAEREEKITTSTLLVWGDSRALEEPSTKDLEQVIERWNDDLLIGWATEKGKKADLMVERLAQKLANLPSQGITTVRFGSLLNVLQRDTRARLGTFLGNLASVRLRRSTEGEEQENPETAGFKWQQGIDTAKGLDRLRALSQCIEQGIEGLPGQERIRESTLRLWHLVEFWTLFATDHQPDPNLRHLEDILDPLKFPSNRQLTKLLGFSSPSTAKATLDRLKPAIKNCFEAQATQSSTTQAGTLSPAHTPATTEQALSDPRGLPSTAAGSIHPNGRAYSGAEPLAHR